MRNGLMPTAAKCNSCPKAGFSLTRGKSQISASPRMEPTTPMRPSARGFAKGVASTNLLTVNLRLRRRVLPSKGKFRQRASGPPSPAKTCLRSKSAPPCPRGGLRGVRKSPRDRWRSSLTLGEKASNKRESPSRPEPCPGYPSTAHPAQGGRPGAMRRHPGHLLNTPLR
jgi:hypothetical protein